jgi:hypothetical protein
MMFWFRHIILSFDISFSSAAHAFSAAGNSRAAFFRGDGKYFGD